KLPCKAERFPPPYTAGIGQGQGAAVTSRLNFVIKGPDRLSRSIAKKKKALSLLIGPPAVPPNWCRVVMEGGIGVAGAAGVEVVLIRFKFWKNQCAEPCHWLVPDLVTTLIRPPVEWPNSAEKPFVRTWNS